MDSVNIKISRKFHGIFSFFSVNPRVSIARNINIEYAGDNLINLYVIHSGGIGTVGNIINQIHLDLHKSLMT